jgi:hypothetical protein
MTTRSTTPRVAWLWAALLLAGVVAAASHAWLTDDIYVTFRYCEQQLSGNGPVYNPGEASEGYSHFLWFVTLTLLHAAGVPLEWLGRYLGIAFFAGTLALLWSASRRLFGTAMASTLPIAALAWAAHEDARFFASSGLETACFTFFLLLGFHFLTVFSHPRRWSLAAWSLATASLVRPDGLLFLGVALVFVVWRTAFERRAVLEFALVATAVVLPLFVFRGIYYGQLFPNPYYAKSGNLSYWSQGLHYLALYLRVYPLLLLAVPMTVLAVLRLWRGRRAASTGAASAGGDTMAALVLAAAFAAVHMAAVTRVGGDFMFARFLLPATPFLLILCEALVRQLPRPALQTGGGLLLAASLLAGGLVKDVWLGNGRHYWGIVDEPQFYPETSVAKARAEGERLATCFEHSGARVLIVAGQLMHAYYARYPQAIELCGLTDPYVAHSALQHRERPGHEKFATADYVYQRGVHFRQRTQRQARSLPPYAVLTVPFDAELLYFEIIVYDDEVLRRLQAACPQVRFLPFLQWLQHEYLPLLEDNSTARLIEDFHRFRRFYFNGHPQDDARLDALRHELLQRGVQDIPASPPHPELFRDFSPYVKNGRLLPH